MMIESFSLLLIPAAIFVLAFVTGGLSNATSGGAGVLTIYVLTAYAGLVFKSADATVLASSTIFVLVGAISFWRKKAVHTQLAITVGVSGVLGAYIGATWAIQANSAELERGFGIFTLGLAAYTIYMFSRDWQKKKRENLAKAEPVQFQSDNSGGSVTTASSVTVQEIKPARFSGKDPASLAVQIGKGVLIGLVTGIFGVSLASLSVVLFIILFRLDMKLVLGTSLFASFLRYAGGTIAFLNTGQINMEYFIILTIGGVAGSIVGAKLLLGDKKGKYDAYVKLIIVLMLLFISYEFLLKYYLPIQI